MLRTFLHIFTILFLSKTLTAQQRVTFQPLRYHDDFSYLKADSSRDWYERLKYKPLSKDGETYLSVGGEVRFRYLNNRNEQWGDIPIDKDGYSLSRALLHGDLHLGKKWRTFVQIHSNLVNGRHVAALAVEEDPLDVHQAFVDYVPLNSADEEIIFRVGRQELAYGSLRLVATRDNPNTRQSFDAVRMIYHSKKHAMRTDFFYSHAVKAKNGFFDDRLSSENKFWGVYSTKEQLGKYHAIDLYYFGIRRRNAVFNDARGSELRHSIGSRIWKNKGDWKYDVEGIYQFGSIAEKRISAWTASLNTVYKFSSIKFTPQIGLKTEIISGDKKVGDNRIQTLNPLYPNGAYFGLAALIGPSNIIDVHPSLRLFFSDKLNFEADYDVFWRHRVRDGIYRANTMPIYTDGQSTERHIGNQFTTSLNYQPHAFLNIRSEFTFFETGKYLKDVSPGKNLLFGGITTQFKF